MTTLLVPYDPNWPALFEAEAIRLRRALGSLAVRIDHHGSTAVPGLSAKPVIDIQISVINLSPLDSYSQPLETLGYVHVPHPDDRFCPFFHRPHEWPHSHHVHVVTAGGEEERRTLAFRDYLRRHDQRRSRVRAAEAAADGRKSIRTITRLAKRTPVERPSSSSASSRSPWRSREMVLP